MSLLCCEHLSTEHQREERKGERGRREVGTTGLIREGRGKVWNNTEGEREKKRRWKKKRGEKLKLEAKESLVVSVEICSGGFLRLQCG